LRDSWLDLIRLLGYGEKNNIMVVNEQTKIAFFKALQEHSNPQQLLEFIIKKLPVLSLEFAKNSKDNDITNLDVPGKD